MLGRFSLDKLARGLRRGVGVLHFDKASEVAGGGSGRELAERAPGRSGSVRRNPVWCLTGTAGGGCQLGLVDTKIYVTGRTGGKRDLVPIRDMAIAVLGADASVMERCVVDLFDGGGDMDGEVRDGGMGRGGNDADLYTGRRRGGVTVRGGMGDGCLGVRGCLG